MAVTQAQKVDFLLKKIGFTKTKTGLAVDETLSGTKKAGFAEAIPSPLIIANDSLWNESGSIPATPPGSDTAQVKVYLAGTSGLRMTEDTTVSGSRAFIAYTTYNDSSTARLTNWIDTQFGASYLIKVYKGDPNSGGVQLSAAGSGANDGWFFDYSAGVLNFNDTNVPSGVTSSNIYIVGYRYIGLTGAPTPTGGGNFTYNDLVVSNNLSVGGLSTFTGLVDINGGGQANTFKVEDLTSGRVVLAGTGGELEDSGNLTFNGSTLAVTGGASFSGNVSIGGTLTYEDVKNVDAVGLITARSGIRVTGGVIEAQAGENKVPALFANLGALPNPGTYHGMFAHVHSTGRGYFSHAGGWYELVNVEGNGVVGTGTQRYNLGALVSTSTTATSLNVTGISTFDGTIDANGDLDVDGHAEFDNVNIAGVVTATTFKGALEATNASFSSNIDANGDLDVDGHTNLDNVSIAGIATFDNDVAIGRSMYHVNDIDTSIGFPTNGTVRISANNLNIAQFTALGTPSATFNTKINATGGTVFVAPTIASNTSPVLTIRNNTQSYHTVLNFQNTNGTSSIIQWNNYNNTSTAGNLIFRSLNSPNTEYARFTGAGNFNLHTDLDVDGHTNLDNVSVAGVTTFSGNARFDSTMTAGGSAGSNGQYLKTTGSGVEWATFPTLRTRQTTTASAGQTTFSFSYTVNFLDVFVNGIKLTDAEFTATNGSTVVLAVGCFVGDIVELVSYNTVSGGGGGGGGISNVVEDTTPELGGNLSLNGNSIVSTGATISSVGNAVFTGIVTGSSFVGDGSGLTGVVGSGSGVVVKNSGSTVGTAGTINFGDNLSVSAISGGSVTITGSAGVSTSQFDVNKLDVSGISTFKGNIDVNADIDVDGHTNLDNVSVAGVTTFTGAITASGALSVSDIRSNSLNLKNAAGNATHATFTNGGSVLLKHNNTDRLETSASGVTVTGTVAATSYTGDGSQLTGITGAGNTTDVRTNTLKVVGVSTFNNTLDLIALSGSTPTIRAINASDKLQLRSNGLLVNNQNGFRGLEFTGSSIQLYSGQMASHKLVLETDAKGIKVGTGVTIETNGQATYAGIVTASSFVGALTGNVTGNADTATEATNVTVTANNSTNETVYPVFVDGATGTQGAETDTGLNYNPSTGNLTSTKFTGDGSGLTGITASGTGIVIKEGGTTVGTAGTINFGTNLDVSAISGGAVTITATAVSAGITTALTGTFTASAGSPSTINTFAYHDNDKVVEYTVYIKNGSDFQTAKVLAMRDSTTIHSTQFAVMFSSSLLAQFDTTISGGNILLRATPETGVSGSTSYRIKREVM